MNKDFVVLTEADGTRAFINLNAVRQVFYSHDGNICRAWFIGGGYVDLAPHHAERLFSVLKDRATLLDESISQ